MMKRQFVLAFSLLAVALIFFVGDVSAQNTKNTKKAKVLHFTRSQGFEHAPAKLLEDGSTVSGVAMKKYGDSNNIEIVESQDGRLFDGDIDQYDAFVFYVSGNQLDENGAKNDKSHAISEAGLKKLFEAVKKGKGFVGIHSASDAFCNQKDEKGNDLYTKFVGARFCGHGPQQFGTVTITEPIQLPSLKDSGKKITTWEEWYGMKDFNPDMHVLLIQETAGMDGKDYDRPPFPATWIRKEGNGRVAYSSFGHDNRYWQNDENVRRIGDLLEWSLGRFDLDTTPNYEKVTPGAGTLPQK
ncbi:MAG: ThuA domain-containing protein [Thermoguttaceae bacterium]